MADKGEVEKALVTGATGFVGRRLVKRLVKDGVEVHSLARPGSDLSVLNGLDTRIVLHNGTAPGMIRIMEHAGPDVVFHLAALTLSDHRAVDVGPLMESNIIFGSMLLEAMYRSGTSNLVNTGTFWQHYQGEDYNPVSLYAATKQAFQDILRYYQEVKGIRGVTLKLYDVYGPGDPRGKIVNLLLDALESGKPLDLTPGEQKLDLVHVDDVADAMALAGRLLVSAESGVAGRSFAVSSGRQVTLRELVDLVGRAAGREVPVRLGAKLYRDREVMDPWIGEGLPGWKAEIGLEEGLSRLIEGRD